MWGGGSELGSRSCSCRPFVGDRTRSTGVMRGAAVLPALEPASEQASQSERNSNQNHRLYKKHCHFPLKPEPAQRPIGRAQRTRLFVSRPLNPDQPLSASRTMGWPIRLSGPFAAACLPAHERAYNKRAQQPEPKMRKHIPHADLPGHKVR